MGSRASVIKDPARGEQFLALLRACPRSRVTDLAAKMCIALSTMRNMVISFEDAGIVASALDPHAKHCARSGPPKVVWIITSSPPPTGRAARIGKRAIPRPAWFIAPRTAQQQWPYAHTGTPAHLAGQIHRFAVQGRAFEAKTP